MNGVSLERSFARTGWIAVETRPANDSGHVEQRAPMRSHGVRFEQEPLRVLAPLAGGHERELELSGRNGIPRADFVKEIMSAARSQRIVVTRESKSGHGDQGDRKRS